MPRNKSKTSLTLSKVGIHSDLHRCLVCDMKLSNDDKVVLMDLVGHVAGWICPQCTSIYDYSDNLTDIGDLDIYSDIRGYA